MPEGIVQGAIETDKVTQVAYTPCWHVTVITEQRELEFTHPTRLELGKWLPWFNCMALTKVEPGISGWGLTGRKGKRGRP